MSVDALPWRGTRDARGASDVVETFVQLLAVLVLLTVSIASFIVSTPFGVGVTLLLTVGFCTTLPAYAPILIVFSFLFQNLIVATFGPMVPSNEVFETLKGTNFVVLVAAFAVFMLAALTEARRLPLATQRWILWIVAVTGVIVLYLALGAARGNTRDALVYFRNTFMPVGCFAIGMCAASLSKVTIERPLVWIATAGLVFGYCEFFFTIDFLSIFNGDAYIERRIADQLASGYWQRVLDVSGFVMRDIHDVMTVPFMNLPILNDLMPSIFRLSGPNFHPISYAYFIAITAVWLLFRNRWLYLVFAFPILLAVGAKGAVILVAFALVFRVAASITGARLASAGLIGLLGVYVTAAVIYGRSVGDYHVLGFLAGIRDFLANPVGQGLGFGGNLSGTIEHTLDWSSAQQLGATQIPVESAIGVMLYQMGVGAFVVIAFLVAVIARCRKLSFATGNPTMVFGFVAVSVILTNGVLQEEAIYSPLALGYCLTLVSVQLGTLERRTRSTLFSREAL